VMIGKNAGKKRPKRAAKRIAQGVLMSKNTWSRGSPPDNLELILLSHVGTELSSNVYPCELDDHMRFLISQCKS
jgi:hypothetical protein